MALDQLKAFLLHLQDDEAVKQSVLAASTADDVAKIASGMGYSLKRGRIAAVLRQQSGPSDGVQAGDAWGIQLIRRQSPGQSGHGVWWFCTHLFTKLSEHLSAAVLSGSWRIA